MPDVEFPSLAEVLAQHTTDDIAGSYVLCQCDRDFPSREAHAAHQAAMWLEARTIRTVHQLDALPRGIVVESNSGTIAAHYGDRRGVVFGDERPFNWQSLALPVVVLWHPGWAATQ